MGRKVTIKEGDVFGNGNLIVLKVIPSGKTGQHTKALIKCCYCNKNTTMRLNVLKKSHSCGCQQSNTSLWTHVGAKNRSWQLPSGIAARNEVEASYKRGAKKRGLGYTLTKEEFDELITGNCFYCGDKLTSIKKGQGKTSGNFEYTGIDRVDNNIGYTKENSVSCCWKCNNMKGTMTIKEFFEHIDKIKITEK